MISARTTVYLNYAVGADIIRPQNGNAQTYKTGDHERRAPTMGINNLYKPHKNGNVIMQTMAQIQKIFVHGFAPHKTIPKFITMRRGRSDLL